MPGMVCTCVLRNTKSERLVVKGIDPSRKTRAKRHRLNRPTLLTKKPSLHLSDTPYSTVFSYYPGNQKQLPTHRSARDSGHTERPSPLSRTPQGQPRPTQLSLHHTTTVDIAEQCPTGCFHVSRARLESRTAHTALQ